MWERWEFSAARLFLQDVFQTLQDQMCVWVSEVKCCKLRQKVDFVVGH